MRQEGSVISWKDDKGFGFIEPELPGPQVFFHIADFRSVSATRPAVQMKVSFELIHVGGKGPRGMAVRPALDAQTRIPSDRRPRSPGRTRASDGPPASGAPFAVPLMAGYFALMAWAVWRGSLPAWVFVASFATNVVTFGLYMHDKFKASQGSWRVPETTLHCWSLAGGWPGAWIAQQLLRHKSAKLTFRTAYWFTAVVHCAAFVGALWYFRLFPT